MEQIKNSTRGPLWTDETVSGLLRLWDEGLSAAKIARALGPSFTRNAVAGKLFRLGLTRSDEQRHEAQSRGGRKGRSRTGRIDPGRRGPPMVPAPPTPPRLCAVTPRLVELTELEPCACRWPYETRDGTRFCARLAKPDRAYCPDHHAIAYFAILPPLTLEALEPAAPADRANAARPR